ncbi:hypothetical protein F909_02944 [Acinetobacter sp. ANC 3929]|uniref:hypothetical protein n=1 Tax=Acinetobacter sp. ANC 3929 TaxID=1217707 RepID=UPI0002CDEFCF|nr:hypothetical protein [Acinetobacter sp. ANC 3929]ENW79840.1 hypothetical protein F909_02944 [Acinetobacter sp. ANC 3929]
MSLKISEFDHQYFVKNHFMLNLALGVLGFLGFLTIKDLNYYYINTFFTVFYILYFIFYILYFIVCVFFYFRIKTSESIVLYSFHRVMCSFLNALVFFVISLTISMNLGVKYFFGYVLLFILISMFIFVKWKALLLKEEYIEVLTDKYFSKDDVSLYDFFFSISNFKYGNSKISVFLALIFSQIAFVLVMNGLLEIHASYELYIIVSLFFLISCYILYNMGVNVILPYSFLKKMK